MFLELLLALLFRQLACEMVDSQARRLKSVSARCSILLRNDIGTIFREHLVERNCCAAWATSRVVFACHISIALAELLFCVAIGNLGEPTFFGAVNKKEPLSK